LQPKCDPLGDLGGPPQDTVMLNLIILWGYFGVLTVCALSMLKYQASKAE
jgi:hypothetical protein